MISKKLILFLTVFILAFAGCEPVTPEGNGKDEIENPKDEGSEDNKPEGEEPDRKSVV